MSVPRRPYKVVAVHTRPSEAAEEKMDERIDVSKCHEAEQEKVRKITKEVFRHIGNSSNLKAFATNGNGQTVVSIMPVTDEVSIPVFARKFHSKHNYNNVEFNSIIDSRFVPLTGELRLIIAKTTAVALSDDRQALVAPPPPVIRRRSHYSEEEEDDNQRGAPSEVEEDEQEPSMDERMYHRPRPYVPKTRR